MIPISDTAPRASPPAVVLLLIAVNALVFLWMRRLPHRELQRVILKYALVPLRYSHPEAALAAGPTQTTGGRFSPTRSFTAAGSI